MKNKLSKLFSTSSTTLIVKPLTPESVEFHQLVTEKIEDIRANIVYYATDDVTKRLAKRHEDRHKVVEDILEKNGLKHGTGQYEKEYRVNWEGLFGKMPERAMFSQPDVIPTRERDKGGFEPEM